MRRATFRRPTLRSSWRVKVAVEWLRALAAPAILAVILVTWATLQAFRNAGAIP